MVRPIFREVMRSEPAVLLSGDVAAVDEQDRAALVEALLQAIEEDRLQERSYQLYRGYRKLAHSGLAEQLRPIIAGKDRPRRLREAAIDMVAACRCTALAMPLAMIALDEGEPLVLRAGAAEAVATAGSDATGVVAALS
jgi:hypothetical protein